MRAVIGRLAADRRYIARRADGGVLLERFFVSAVVAFLLLRFYLQATGFPKVGGHGLHIAHMLWGGILLLAAVVILLGFLGGTARIAAAMVGGIGFGVFIDELGKFITTDNNYFYRPTIALIYAVFVVLFLVLRAIERARPRSDAGSLANALEVTSETVLHGFDSADRDRALVLLQSIREENPFATALRDALASAETTPNPSPGSFARAEARLRREYRAVVESTWFSRSVVIGVFAYAALSSVALVGVALSTDVSFARGVASVRADVTFSALADVMILLGALSWRSSRASGLIWFKRSILVTILLAQPFLFYGQQLAALAWLALDLLILETLNYMIGQERLMAVSLPSRGGAGARPRDRTSGVQAEA